MAMRRAKIFLETLPTSSTEHAIDALEWPFRIVRLLHREIVIVIIVPVVTPLIDVAGHVVEAIIVGWIAHDRRRVGAEIVGLGPVDVDTSGIDAIDNSSRRRDLPFGFRGKTLADPFRISNSAVIGDAYNWMFRVARFNGELATKPLDAGLTETDDIVVVVVFFPAHRI